MVPDRSNEDEFVLDCEFGITHADLHRILPRLVAPAPVERLEDAVSIRCGDGRALVIEYTAERQRRIASLRMPYTVLRFRFAGWDETQRAEFMEKFRRAFQKGGG